MNLMGKTLNFFDTVQIILIEIFRLNWCNKIMTPYQSLLNRLAICRETAFCMILCSKNGAPSIADFLYDE